MGLWDQLNTETLEDGSDPTKINAQTKDIHIQETNKSVLQDTVLINSAVLRDGRHIPGTGQVMQFTNTDEVRTAIWTPNAGEVWRIQALSVTLTGRSGTVVHNLFYQDVSGESTNGNVIKWHTESLTSSDAVLDDADSSSPQDIDSNFSLQYQAEGTFTDSTLNIAVYRIR